MQWLEINELSLFKKPVYSILHLAFSFLITYRLGYKMVIK